MPRYAELVYNGFWFSPERIALQEMIDKTQAFCEGTVRLKLYKASGRGVGGGECACEGGGNGQRSAYPPTHPSAHPPTSRAGQRDCGGPQVALLPLRQQNLLFRGRRRRLRPEGRRRLYQAPGVRAGGRAGGWRARGVRGADRAWSTACAGCRPPSLAPTCPPRPPPLPHHPCRPCACARWPATAARSGARACSERPPRAHETPRTGAPLLRWRPAQSAAAQSAGALPLPPPQLPPLLTFEAPLMLEGVCAPAATPQNRVRAPALRPTPTLLLRAATAPPHPPNHPACTCKG